METEEGGEMEVAVDEQKPPLLVPEVVMKPPASETEGDEGLSKNEEAVVDLDNKMDQGDGDEEGGGGDFKDSSEQQLSSGSECLDDPNFAIICSFLENFGQHIRLGEFPFDELQMMLENTTEVPERLVKLHIALLRRVFKTITVDKWERSLAKFGHTYCNQDGWEIERFGYKKAKLPTKLRILKNLLESQFDYNVKFKAEVNKLEAGDLRLIPLGRDCEGQVYWYQVDNDANLRVYREDVDDESWEIVASNREEFVDLIEKLQKGDVRRPQTDAVAIDEDSNEKEIETNEIILDTGKVVNDNEDGDSDESEEDMFEKVQVTKPVQADSAPLVAPQADLPLPVLEPVIENVEEIVCAIKTKVHPEETTEQLSKLEDITSNNKQAGADKSVNDEPAKDNLAIKKEASENLEAPLLKESVESSIPSVEPLIEKKTVSKADHIPEPPKKLHQPYQDAVSATGNSTYLQQTDEKSSLESTESNTLSVPNTLLKIEEEVITEDSIDIKQKEIEVPVASKSPKPETVGTAKISKSPEEVIETCQSVKTWVCGDVSKKDSKAEAMDLEMNSSTQEQPLIVKEIPDPVQKDSCTVDEQVSISSTVERELSNAVKNSNFPESDTRDQENKKKETGVQELLTKEASDLDSKNESIQQETLKEKIQIKPEATDDSVQCNEVIKNENDSEDIEAQKDIKCNQDTEYESSRKTDVLHEHKAEVVLESKAIDALKEIEQTGFVKIENRQDLLQNQKHLSSEETDMNNPVKAVKEQLDIPTNANAPETSNDRSSTTEQSEATSDLCKPEASKVEVSAPEQTQTSAATIFEFEASKVEEQTETTTSFSESAANNPDISAPEQMEIKTNLSESESSNADVSATEKLEISNRPSESEPSRDEIVSLEFSERSIVEDSTNSTCSDVFQKELAQPVQEPAIESSSSIVSEPIEPTVAANALQSDETISEPVPAAIPPASVVVPESDVPSVSLPKQPYSISVLLEPKKASDSPSKLIDVPITEPETSTELSTASNVDSESSESKEPPIIDTNRDNTASMEDSSTENVQHAPTTIPNTQQDIKLGNKEITNCEIGSSVEATASTSTEQPLIEVTENKIDLIPSESTGNEAEKTELSTSVPPNPTEKSSLKETKESDKPEESPMSTLPTDSTVVASTPVETSNSPTKESKPTTSSLLGLASYDSSSDEDEKATDLPSEIIPSSEFALKRKADDGEGDVPVKVAKLEEKSELSISNPIVGDVVEEEIMHITGEGSGAMNEGGNDEALTSQRSQTLSSQEEADSSNDDSQESLEVQKPRKRGRPGKRGRKPGTKVASLNTTPKERKPRSSTGSRGSREIARLGVPIETQETNGNGESNERPVRASRRIAQIRLKEEEERRKLEEERLAQLKADQLRKQQRKAEAEKLGGSLKPKKSKKGFAKTPGTVGDYLPSPSASESESGEDDGDEFQVEKLKKGRKKKRRSNGKHALKPGSKPWATSSSDEDSEAVEEEEEYHYEEEEQLVFNESDHEFSPESDLGEDSEAHPSRHARTAKRGEKAEEEETGCMKCGKGDHPEWILLCDKCDQGWHASCLRPQLWVIPEGEWFCPPCQHNMLVTKLSANLVEFDKLLKKRENDILRKQRLEFVNVSLNNVLPEKTEEEKAAEAQEVKAKAKEKERNSRRRRILSDEELSDTFINDRSDNEISENSDDDSEDGPIYRLRARRAAKTFDYKEYDDMINSALRASDDEGVDEQTASATAPENGTLNGNTNEEPKSGEAEESQSSAPAEEKHSGKNEAYEKYLQQKEEEFDSDDELLDEKERLRRKAAKSKGGNKRKKRSFRDLDDYTDEDNSDEDFKGSEAEDDEELDEDAVEEDESEWSGDQEESDDSLARRSRNTAKGKKVKYGRREEYLDVGAVRRSTRARRKARVSYDESDQDDDEEPEEKWQSDQSEEEEETPSESDDETYGKRKKKKAAPPRSAVPRFFLGAIGKETAKKAPKKKKRKVDEDDVDRAWSSSQGSKAKKKAAEEQVERRTRGRKINFKDILDSGESDDDGNIRPKRRRISSDEEEDEAETSRRLAEEIKAANQREAAMYAAMQKQNSNSTGAKSSASAPTPTATPSLLASALSGGIEAPAAKVISTDAGVKKNEMPSGMPPMSSNPLEMLSNSAKSLGGTLPLSSESLIAKVDAGPPVLKPENSLSQPGTLEMALSKPVPAPPIPQALAKALGRTKSTSSNPPAGPGAAAVNTKPIHSSHPHPSESLIPAHLPPVVPPMTSATLPIPQPPIQAAISSPPVTPIPPPPPQKHSRSKKEKGSKAPPSASPPAAAPSSTPPTTIQSPLRPMTPPMQQQGLVGLPPQGLPPGLPMDIGRVPNPTLYQGNPAMRPFHPMWVRNPTPPPYGGGGGPPTSIGKPPPLNSGPFMSQHGAQRPGFSSQPPPLRVPNPNPSSLQAFQHFKRDQMPGHGMYRMPPGQQGGIPGILAAGLMGQPGPPDSRFFGGPNPYGPYGILPPHTQSQPHPSMFGVPPYEFRPGEPFAKEEPRGTPPSTGPSSPPVSQPLPPTTISAAPPPKDEVPPPPPSQTESEFGGLVSYFSSQRSEEDMDS